jgi:hypothetical protein
MQHPQFPIEVILTDISLVVRLIQNNINSTSPPSTETKKPCTSPSPVCRVAVVLRHEDNSTLAALSQHGHPLPPPEGQGHTIIEASPSHRVSHTTFGRDSSGRVISPKHRPLLDNTQHSQDKGSHAPSGIRNRNRSKRGDQAATRICHSVCSHTPT